MKDMLGWTCEEGCDCLENNHVHYDGSLHESLRHLIFYNKDLNLVPDKSVFLKFILIIQFSILISTD